MVADDLATALADKYVQPGHRVLDPFCGSGRLLLAAAQSHGHFVGIDVNPLACLITAAKAAHASVEAISELIQVIEVARPTPLASTLNLRDTRKVDWYSDAVLAELGQIISWINKLDLRLPEKTVVAAALSATARDASYCRKRGWKLHRLDPTVRARHSISAWDCLARRLIYYVTEAAKSPPVNGCVSVVCSDSKKILVARSGSRPLSLFDLILTSPPYGDSRTTVQYGATSSLWLDVVSHVNGFENFFVRGSDIDRQCLGGGVQRVASPELADDLKAYWAGSRHSQLAARVIAFLADFAHVCENISSCVKPGGRVVLVLGQRSTGGFRLKLDTFAAHCFERLGFRLLSNECRRLREKRLPKTINRYARARSAILRAKGGTKTIDRELILMFEKPAINVVRELQPFENDNRQ